MGTYSRSIEAVTVRKGTYSIDPILKAYILAYLTSTAPRLPFLLRSLTNTKLTIDQKISLLKDSLTGALGTNRFPTSCAVIVGGSTVLPRIVCHFIASLQRRSISHLIQILLDIIKRWTISICAFSSAWWAFTLLNRDARWQRKRASSVATRARMRSLFADSSIPAESDSTTEFAGRTIDLTLFSVCRALDVAVITVWKRVTSDRFHSGSLISQSSSLVEALADPAVFASSAAVIMWSWFYSPERLPKQYNGWISKVADIDYRLIDALRQCRRGELIYGSPDSTDADLPSLCQELGLPISWGTPAETIPIPCELYHCGTGRSCEIHAGKRFLRTFWFAVRLYLPLQCISLLRRFSFDSKQILNLVKSAASSSSFLAAFVSFFYYGVCLARTRLGPQLLDRSQVSPQMWDSGLCVLAGCLACGWSIMFEKSGRRQEMASFVAPRALATMLPRVYSKKYQRREQLAFATSVAIVMTTLQTKRHRIRGVFGKILNSVLE